jgi:hypothetical protein
MYRSFIGLCIHLVMQKDKLKTSHWQIEVFAAPLTPTPIHLVMQKDRLKTSYWQIEVFANPVTPTSYTLHLYLDAEGRARDFSLADRGVCCTVHPYTLHPYWAMHPSRDAEGQARDFPLAG